MRRVKSFLKFNSFSTLRFYDRVGIKCLDNKLYSYLLKQNALLFRLFLVLKKVSPMRILCAKSYKKNGQNSYFGRCLPDENF